MRFKPVWLLIIYSASLVVCSHPQESIVPHVAGLYLGQEPPGETPMLFASGIVSLPGHTEYSGTFASNGQEYYFYRFSDSMQATIHVSKVVAEEWTAPEPVDFSAGYAAFEPHITFDNASLYFTWDKGSELPGIWVTTRELESWSEPQYAGQGMFVSSDSMGNIYVTDMSSVTIDGKTYLAKVTLRDGLFDDYQRLDIAAHYGNQAHPCISLDGDYIIFDVDSGHYMYVCFKRQDGTWGEAIDLTNHGFDPMAGGATISPDGKYIFFCLNKDIWWVDARIIEELHPEN